MSSIETDEIALKNTDKTIWTKKGKAIDEGYLPEIFVTEEGNIGIKVGGTVIVKPVEAWHGLAEYFEPMSLEKSMALADRHVTLSKAFHNTGIKAFTDEHGMLNLNDIIHIVKTYARHLSDAELHKLCFELQHDRMVHR